MLLNEGTIHGRRVLSPESVALMRSNLVGDLYDGGVAYPNSKGTGFGILVRTILDPAACGCGRSRAHLDGPVPTERPAGPTRCMNWSPSTSYSSGCLTWNSNLGEVIASALTN